MSMCQTKANARAEPAGLAKQRSAPGVVVVVVVPTPGQKKNIVLTKSAVIHFPLATIQLTAGKYCFVEQIVLQLPICFLSGQRSQGLLLQAVVLKITVSADQRPERAPAGSL